MHRISPSVDIPGCVLRLNACTDAPSLLRLQCKFWAMNANASAKSARTYDSGHYSDNI